MKNIKFDAFVFYLFVQHNLFIMGPKEDKDKKKDSKAERKGKVGL